MGMKHEVLDMDRHFVVNADTRNITRQSTNKVMLMQYDHNSEVFTFEVPRNIEGHDMQQCDVIQVHYENTSTGTSSSTRRTYRGVTPVDDITTEVDKITFSWLVPETATMFAGSLKFQLKFICYDNEFEDIVGYKWHTNVNSDISITAGLAYSESDMTPSTTATLQSLEIVEVETGLEIILDGRTYNVYHGGYIDTDMGVVEFQDNKIETIDSDSTHSQYPSAKAVYDLLNSTIIEALTTDVEV